MTGVRAELAVDDLAGCPVASASADEPVRDVTWAETANGTVEQFATTGEPGDGDGEPVFAYDDLTVFEFTRDDAEPCFCEAVERHLGPLTDVHAEDGTLHVTVHATDVANLRSLVGRLSEEYGPVRLEYLVRTRSGEGDAPVVPVDLGRLTDRQREVVATAYEMGYFEYPRTSNGTEVSAALDIEPSTFSEHLAAAQSKLLEDLLDRQ